MTNLRKANLALRDLGGVDFSSALCSLETNIARTKVPALRLPPWKARTGLGGLDRS